MQTLFLSQTVLYLSQSNPLGDDYLWDTCYQDFLNVTLPFRCRYLLMVPWEIPRSSPLSDSPEEKYHFTL